MNISKKANKDKQMILRVPSYYKTFQCIADKCEDTVGALAGRLILMRIPMIITWGLRERLESA